MLPTAQCLQNLGLGYLADLNRESIWECTLNHECCVKIRGKGKEGKMLAYLSFEHCGTKLSGLG